MSEFVEQLRAQAVELRRRAEINATKAVQTVTTSPYPPIWLGHKAEWMTSLADLTHGMLTQHQICGHGPQFAGGEIYDADAWCETCGSEALDDGACPSLRLLETHVSAVLSGCTETAREGR